MEARERLASGDPIRVIATVAVVLQHVSHAAFRNPGLVSPREWAFATGMVSFTNWAVPVFVLLSGALLLERRPESLAAFYRRRFARVGIPLVFWSGAYLLVSAVAGSDTSLWALLERLAEGRPYYHLYFLYVIAGLYLVTPMLRTWAATASEREIRLAVGLTFAVAAGGSMLGARGGTALTRFIPYLGYFLAGWAIRRGVLRWHPSWTTWGTAALSAAALTAVTIGIGDPRGLTTAYLLDYLSVLLIPMSVAVFAALVAWPWPPPEASGFSRACAALSPLTLGVYLIHPALLKVFAMAGIRGTQAPVELWIPGVAALALVASTAIAWVMSRLRPTAVLIGL